MLENLTKQEIEVKATFTKIQGAKEVVSALIEEAKATQETPKVKKDLKVKLLKEWIHVKVFVVWEKNMMLNYRFATP